MTTIDELSNRYIHWTSGGKDRDTEAGELAELIRESLGGDLGSISELLAVIYQRGYQEGCEETNYSNSM